MSPNVWCSTVMCEAHTVSRAAPSLGECMSEQLHWWEALQWKSGRRRAYVARQGHPGCRFNCCTLLAPSFSVLSLHCCLCTVQCGVELYRDDRSGFSYRVPDGTEVDVFRAAVEALPGQESPEIFGLHPNADLTFRTLQVQEGMATILDTMPKGAGGSSGLSREETVDRICEDLLSKVCRHQHALGQPNPFTVAPPAGCSVQNCPGLL